MATALTAYPSGLTSTIASTPTMCGAGGAARAVDCPTPTGATSRAAPATTVAHRAGLRIEPPRSAPATVAGTALADTSPHTPVKGAKALNLPALAGRQVDRDLAPRRAPGGHEREGEHQLCDVTAEVHDVPRPATLSLAHRH